MRILVVNPPSKDKSINRDMAGGLGYSAGESVVLPPLDLLNMVTTLKKKGYEVLFVDAIARRIGEGGFWEKIIARKKIEIIVANLALPTVDEEIEFVNRLTSRFPKLRVILKTGINYRQILERVMRETRVERIIFGECDLTIDQYLRKTRSSGSVSRVRGKIVYKPLTIKDRIANLDKIPIPDRTAGRVANYRYVLLPGKVTTMQTSRGCPYPCGFYCPYPLVQGKAWRAMTPPRIIDELRQIRKLGIKSVLFRDATFTLDNRRTEEMCQLMVKAKLGIKWWCETRINVLTPELLRKMKEAGCVGINVGVETLDQELIIHQGKPGVSLEAVKAIREAAKKCGVRLHFLMIIGLPDDNLKTMLNTFNYLVELNPESVGFSTITPYPGTEMFDQAVTEGLVTNFDWNKFNGSLSNMRTKYLSSIDLWFLRRLLLLTAYGMKQKKPLSMVIVGGIRIWLEIWKKIRKD